MIDWGLFRRMDEFPAPVAGAEVGLLVVEL